MRIVPASARLLAALGLAFAAACGGASTPSPEPSGAIVYSALDRLKLPALISIDLDTGALVYWPTRNGPTQNPITFTKSLGITQAYAMAASGRLVAISSYKPPEIVLYDTRAKKVLDTLSDTYGGPLDVALDKYANVYAMNVASVEAFKFGTQGGTYELHCPYITDAVAIAVDKEGGVYVNGYGPSSFMGVIEYPPGSGSGPESCIKLNLEPELGYVGGLAIDPKTDDLLVVDNPGECAGGVEGRLTIYPRPYRSKRFRQVDLNAQYCGGAIRLDKGSKHLYLADATVSDGWPLIDVRTYPAGSGDGYYSTGYGDVTGGFTTIPNTLPN